MKTFAIASVIALASVASAQLNSIPQCALSCLVGPLSSDGCSSLTDFNCHCQKGASLIATVEPCVSSACSASDQAATLAAIQQTCKNAGIPIEVPNAPGAVSSAVAGATSAAAGATSAAAGATSAAASAAASKASAAYSAAATVSSAIAPAVSSAASRVSGAAAPTSRILSGTSTPRPSQFTGGAPQATNAAGLLGAAALAFLAL